MPSSSVSTITRAATRSPDEPLNILTFPTHERYESVLCKTGHNFYAITNNSMKQWNNDYAKSPDNYHIYSSDNEKVSVPLYLDFDLVLSHSKFGQFEIAKQICRNLQLPLVTLEHTLPLIGIDGGWSDREFTDFSKMRGHLNVFISDFSMNYWKWEDRGDAKVIYHGIDLDTFSPADSKDTNKNILSVVNEFQKRDYCCGYKLWQRVTQNLPVKVLGDNPGMSKPAASIEELADCYRNSTVFLNTSTFSPVPMSLLEAMSCGCAVVSTSNCMIPEVIENGVNGFITNDENEMSQRLAFLLNDENKEVRKMIGNNARKTIEERFSQDRFVSEWKELFTRASQIVYNGVKDED